MLLPFMPHTAENMLYQIGLPKENMTWESLYKVDAIPEETKVIAKGGTIVYEITS